MLGSNGRWLGLCGVAMVGLACRPVDTACTEMAVSSVSLTVEDAAGDAISGATATFSVDGGAARDCDIIQAGELVCGFELAGEFEITVSADGFESKVLTLEVVAGACHVESEVRTVALDPDDVACTEEIVPSIEVTVEGSSGEVLEDVDVTYAPDGGDDPAPCTTVGGGDTWWCGQEEAGDFVVVAIASGHAAKSADVSVGMTEDGCHVATEQVTLALEWLPD